MNLSDIFFLILVIIFTGSFAVRNRSIRKKLHIDPYRFNKSSDRQKQMGRIAHAITILWIIIVALEILKLDFWKSFQLLSVPIIQIGLGYTLLIIGLMILIIAQWQMKDSWREGIDDENQIEFIESGLFRYSRNPVFSGILIFLSGITVKSMHLLAVILWAITFWAFLIQIKSEEEFLANKFGERYKDYCFRTPRFLRIKR